MTTTIQLPEPFKFDNLTIEFKVGKRYPFAAICIKQSEKMRFGYKVVFNYGFQTLDKCLDYCSKYIRE